MTQLTRHLAVSGAQSCYCFSFRLFQDTIQDLLSVANFGRFEVEDYGGVVKCGLSICRTRSRTISPNPYQSRLLHVLMLQPGVTVLVSLSALGVCDKTRRRSMTRPYPPKTRSGQKPGSNMHKTISFP